MRTALKRFLREPLLHFFVLGALIFLVHRVVAGDARTIVVSPGLRAELGRRLRDQLARAPTSAELEESLRAWQRDEALFREALREKLDRDDPAVRAVLINKLRAELAQKIPKREPTEAELAQWLVAHRELYETPVRYQLEWVGFAKDSGRAAEQRTKFEEAARAGADVRFLGHPIFGATLTAEEAREKLGAEASAALSVLPLRTWRPTESARELLLVRVNQVEGGLPRQDELRPRLVIDASFAAQQAEIERAITGMTKRYRFKDDSEGRR